MANPPSMFEQIMLRHAPIQKAIIQNLTRWDFRNLQLAGIRVPVSRECQRKYLKPDRCNDYNPGHPGELCANSTAFVDEMRACEGRHIWFSDGVLHIKKWIGHQDIKPCLLSEKPLAWDSSEEPNTDTHPIHTKVCKRCRDFYVAEHLNERLRTITTRFPKPLCKRHSLAHANRFPLNACRCAEILNSKWRCSTCLRETMDYLELRADVCRIWLTDVKVPWSHPISWIRNRVASWKPLCPIEGCFRQPWIDEREHERMHMCMGCTCIIKI